MVRSSADHLHVTSISTAVSVLLLVTWQLLAHRLRSRFLTEGSLAALMGLTTGILLLAFQRYLEHGVLKSLLVFDSSTFLVYLLPPVIFYAGLSVHKKLFFGNLGTILCMGIIGTLISFVIISVVLYAFTQFHVLRFQDCLALGAIFSATDSVATLQVLDVQTMPLLFSLVFGEGVINDATSVVLLGAVSRVFPPTNTVDGTDTTNTTGTDEDHSSHGLGVVGSFLYLYSTSLVVGLATGGGIAFLLRRKANMGSHQEMALVAMLSYLSYLAAEISGLSGILSLFCCGIAVSHWVLPVMSEAGSSTTTVAFQTLSHISEGIIFIYVGMDALDPVKWQATYPGEAVPLIFVLLFLLLTSRALGVIPMALLHNFWGSTHLSSRDLVIIWWSGLMRGAVSVALVYYYFDNQSMDGHRATVIASTLVVVLFTTVVFGMLTKPLLSLLLEERPEQPLRGLVQERLNTIKMAIERLPLPAWLQRWLPDQRPHQGLEELQPLQDLRTVSEPARAAAIPVSTFGNVEMHSSGGSGDFPMRDKSPEARAYSAGGRRVRS